MKPYLAVIYDSFVEAMGSKVLWFLMIAWTLILAGVAPFGFVHDRSYEFASSEILLRDSMVEKLEAAARKKGTKAQQAVVAAMKTDSQELLAREKKSEGRRFSSGRVAELLNEALESKTLYDEEAWPTAAKRSELKEFLEKPVEQLSEMDRQHLNRRLIEYSFPNALRPVNENRIWVGYAGMKVSPSPLPLSETQGRYIVEMVVLRMVMKVGLGIVAMLVAIVVTSSMVPDMFQPGALHLLLSKPVSRSLLFLSKFLGGTIFVAINIAYLLTGLYLIAGIRLGIWNAGLLVCIPVFVFIFMIFYSVSALVGLIWKNAIVSVVVTAVFWLICFVIGIAHDIMKPFVEMFPEISELRLVEGQYFAINQLGMMTMWDAKTRSWQVAYDSARGGNAKILGPYWFADKGELLYGRTFQNSFGLETDNIRMTIVDLSDLKQRSKASKPMAGSDAGNAEETKDEDPPSDKENQESELSSTKSDLWSDKRTDSAPNFPVKTRRAIEFQNTLLVLTDVGLFQLDRTRIGSKPESQGAITDFIKDAFSRMAPQVKSSAYAQVSVESWMPAPPMDFAATPAESSLVVYQQGRVNVLRPNDAKKWEVVSDIEVFDKKEVVALIAANQDGWLLIGDDQIPILGSLASDDRISLEVLGKQSPRRLLVSPVDQSFILLNNDGEVWTISKDGSKIEKPKMAGQGEAVAIALDSQGQLMVAHHINQLDRWDLKSGANEVIARPTMRIVDRVFYWVVLPIYWVNPKPSAVDDTIQYCLQREEKSRFSFDASGLTDARPKIDPWQPLWSNSIFIGFMLLLGCLYLHRQDL